MVKRKSERSRLTADTNSAPPSQSGPVFSPRMLTCQLQPWDSGTCTFAAISMVAGIPLDLAISASNMRACSNGVALWRDVKSVLKAFGVLYGGIKSGSSKKIPNFCIAFMSDRVISRDFCEDEWAHCVTILDGFVYDPSIGWPMPLRVYEDFILKRAYTTKANREARWTSFLPILSAPPTASRYAASIPALLGE